MKYQTKPRDVMARLERNEGTSFRFVRRSVHHRPAIQRLTFQQFNAVWGTLSHKKRAELSLFAHTYNVTVWAATEAWWHVHQTDPDEEEA